MGYEAIPRAYAGVVHGAFVPHSRFLDGRWTGVVEVVWTIDAAHPVAIGAGWFGLVDSVPPKRSSLGLQAKKPLPPKPPEIVAEIVRRGSRGVPVLPGSSLKGAVRQVYELLTPSCQLARGACRVRPKDAAPQVCPACSVFGAPGLGGRLAFGEASPVPGAPLSVLKKRTPAGWQPRVWKDGTLRAYDLKTALNRAGQTAATGELTYTVSGRFESRVRVINASGEELGLLFASLGVGGPSPMVRVGGKKYHGLGAADVALARAHRRFPSPAELAGENLDIWARKLVDAALGASAPRRAAWDALHAIFGRV